MQNYKLKDELKEPIEYFIKEVNPREGILATMSLVQHELRKMIIDMQDASKDGATLGKYIDKLIPKRLSEYSNNLTFVHGHDGKDKDCICLENEVFNCEIKTSAASKRPVGAKTNAGRVKNGTKYDISRNDYEYMIFCKYYLCKEENCEITLFPEEIWVGMIKVSDWKFSSSAGSGSAWITSETLHTQFVKVYDYDESRKYRQIEEIEKQIRNNADNFKNELITFDEFNAAQYLLYTELAELKK